MIFEKEKAMKLKSTLWLIGGNLGYIFFLLSFLFFLGASDPGAELAAIPATFACLILGAISLLFLAIRSWKNVIIFIMVLFSTVLILQYNCYRIAILDSYYAPEYFGVLSSLILGISLSAIYIILWEYEKTNIKFIVLISLITVGIFDYQMAFSHSRCESRIDKQNRIIQELRIQKEELSEPKEQESEVKERLSRMGFIQLKNMKDDI